MMQTESGSLAFELWFSLKVERRTYLYNEKAESKFRLAVFGKQKFFKTFDF
jgi:hypothetical protein